MSFYRRRIFLNVPSSRLHIQQRIHRCYGRPNLIVSQRRRWASELVPCVSEEYSIAASYTSLAVERLLQRQTGTFVDPVDYQLACSYWNNVARWIRQSARHDDSNQNPLVQHSLPIAWQLLERTVQEYGLLLQKRSSDAAASSDGGGGAFFLDPNQYVDLFEAWSERSTPRDSSPPKDLLRTLYQLTGKGFYLPYNAAILNAILSALIPRRPTPAALDQATTLLQVLAAASPEADLADTYALLIRAWTVAAQQEFVAHVDAKIDALLQAYHHRRRSPAHRHAAPYVAALSYYAHGRQKAAAVAAIYSMMQSQGCAISCHAFPELIGGWLLVDGRADAEALWARQVRAAAPKSTKTKWVDLIDDDELDRSTPVDAAMERRALFRSAVALLDYYRQRLVELTASSPAADPHIIDVPPTSTTEEQQSLLQSAEQVWEQLEASEEDDEGPDLDRARSLLLHIYAAVQQVRAAEALWLVIRHPDRSTDCTMMRLYQREPERVEEVLERRIAADNRPNQEEEAIDVDMVNEVLDAWMLHLFPEGTPRTSAYKIPQVTERIFQIYRRFFHHPTKGVIKLLPNTATYSKVLQSLIVFCLRPLAVTVEAKERIKGILQEIQERLHSKSFQLETPMCNVILRAYLMVLGNHRRALELLQRMEQSLDGSVSTSSTDHVTSWWHGSDVPRPDRDTYMEFMKYHAQFQSVRSAKHVEQIHDRMRELSKRSKKVDTSLEPNAFSYDILLSAWAHAKLKKRSDHIWTIFQNLYNVEKIPMQPCIFATLLNYFSKSTRAEDICKAVYLLEIMEQYSEEHSIRGIKPSGRQYCMVLDGCINVGAFRNAAGVIRSMLDSYANESQGPDEEPSHRAFGWIIQMYIDKGDFDSPFLFLHEVTEKTEHKDHLCGIQPHIGTVVHLRTKMLQSVQPLAIRPGLVQMVQSIDGYIIPNVMRARNLKKSKETPWPFQTEYPGR